MEIIAISKSVRVAPRKVRLVADAIRKLSIADALVSLSVLNKRAALSLSKTLKSAVANAKNNNKVEVKDFFKELYEKLSGLHKRLKEFEKISGKIKHELRDYDIIHREKKGINVIVKMHGPEEEAEIIDYCKYRGYDTTLCPRYIRVLDDAISIEIKRL